MTITPVPVAFANFAPDLSDYTAGYSDANLNIEPTADGFREIPSFTTTGTALAAACKGAITVRLIAGSTSIFALTATKAYKLDPSDITWDDVTRLVGGDYNSPTFWSLEQYGPTLVAVNGTDTNQYIDVDSGTNFAALSNAPKATYVTTMGDHLLLGKLDGAPRSVAWSGVNDATYWTYGYRGSDIQEFPDGGNVQNVLRNGTGAIVFQSDKIRVIERVGGNYVFATRVLHEGLGCYAPYSVAQTRNTFVWYAQSGFYMGLEAKAIGHERVNRFVENICTDRENIRSVVDPSRDMVWWLIPTASGTFMLGYDWNHDKWTRSDSNVDYAFTAISPGFTIDGLDNIAATMDALVYPFDSAFYGGDGLQAMAGFSSAGAYGNFAGATKDATFETVDLEFNKGGSTFVDCVRLEGDMDYSDVTVQVGTRRYQGDPIVWSSAVAADSATGRAWVRARGSTLRFRLNIASSDWNNATGFTAWIRQAGKR